jgi:hypothetical protein
MNLEHGWPQAKGASEGKLVIVNMHHLFHRELQSMATAAIYPLGKLLITLRRNGIIWY